MKYGEPCVKSKYNFNTDHTNRYILKSNYILGYRHGRGVEMKNPISDNIRSDKFYKKERTDSSGSHMLSYLLNTQRNGHILRIHSSIVNYF